MRRLVLLNVLGVAVVVGCGPGGPERVVLSGAVSYNGQDVGNGRIVFEPIDGTKGSGAAGRITRGKFRIEAKGGVPVGAYLVRIQGFELQPEEKPPGPVIGLGDRFGKQYVPAKYNIRSTLQIVLESGSGATTKDFHLSK
jgi:hypothetical protein